MNAGAPIRLHSGDDKLVITTFDSRHREHFARLNLVWLRRFFTIEPVDERVLGNPESAILASGGEVLFAMLEGAVVGTVAIKREPDGSFELTKMAVDEAHQGRGYGKRLLEAACALARQRGAARIFLYSHRSLTAAVQMYRKHGFIERPHDNERYTRCDIMMEMTL